MHLFIIHMSTPCPQLFGLTAFLGKRLEFQRWNDQDHDQLQGWLAKENIKSACKNLEELQRPDGVQLVDDPSHS